MAESSVVLPPVSGAILCHSAISFNAMPSIPTLMSAAYEGACKALGLADRSDPLTQLVAKKIIGLATRGERDPERICAEVLRAFGRAWDRPPQEPAMSAASGGKADVANL